MDLPLLPLELATMRQDRLAARVALTLDCYLFEKHIAAVYM